jgi:hypothetical protein
MCLLLAILDPLSKKELKAMRKKENRCLHEQYHKEVKEFLAKNWDIRVRILIDATSNIIGLKVKWQNVVKDIAYQILDLRIRHWDQHPQEQKDEIYRQVEAHFIYNPPLQDGYIEKYLKNHLILARRKWKEHWLMHGDSNRHPNCPPKVWLKMIQYWKSLNNIAKSAQMKENQSKVRNLSTCGLWALVNGFILSCVVVFHESLLRSKLISLLIRN